MLTDELQAILEALWVLAPPRENVRVELEGFGLGPARMEGAHCRILTMFGRLIIELSDETGFPHHAIIAQYDKRLIAHVMPEHGEYQAIRRWQNRPDYDRHVLGTHKVDGVALQHVRLTCKNRPPVVMDADCWLDPEGFPRKILFWLPAQLGTAEADSKATPYETWVATEIIHEPIDKQMFEIPANFVAVGVGSGNVYNAGKLMNGWRILNSRIQG